MSVTTEASKTNFIRHIINEDIATDKHQQIVTRFPPEPNGYLHIGHAKSICLNFELAQDYPGAYCYLRFDDTNPEKEEAEYLEAIKADVSWLGFNWGEHLTYASDYYEIFYQKAELLIQKGKAYVCSLSPEQARAYRGTLTEPGKPSPDRDRSVEESLDLFRRMRAGEFEEGAYTLRAKIDMGSGNINLRDPMIYRIRKQSHHRTGDTWCLYPMYDYAHPLEDAIEGITHSLCTLEFEDHRPLYDWFVNECEMDCKPRQIEFSRLELNYTITSKRKLKRLVDESFVSGWDDPRMPTLRGLRRRGVTPTAIRNLCQMVGISKQKSIIDMSLLEQCVRDDLNQTTQRRLAVLNPIKVVITNYEGEGEALSVPNHPQQPKLGRREVQFGRELYIESDDFMLEPPSKYFRLAPGKEVRLMNAYVIRCDEIIHTEEGDVAELRCTYLPETLGGKKPAHGGKVKGVVHWVNAKHCLTAEVRLYDRLFNIANPAKEEDFTQALNPDSLQTITSAKVEPGLADAQAEETFQFNRLGYFCADRYEHSGAKPVFNRVVTLKDTWEKLQQD